MTIKELSEKRAKLVAEARAILNAAPADGMKAEDEAKFDQIMADADALKAQIDREMRLSELENEMRASTGVVAANGAATQSADDVREAFARYLRTGEIRATVLTKATDGEGGVLAPDEIYQEIVALPQMQNAIKDRARVVETTKPAVTVPVANGLAATWVSESGNFGNPTTDSAFAKKQFAGHKVGAIVPVTFELLQDSAFPIGRFLTQEAARMIGRAEWSAYAVGTGSGQPQGIVTGATVGKTTASTSAITQDELLDTLYSLGAQYRPNSVWLMHSTTLATVRKLNSSAPDSDPVWAPGRAGQPDTVVGRPVFANDNIATIEADAKVAVLVDLAGFMVVQEPAVTVRRLNELYAGSGEIGFLIYRREDAKLVDANAAKVLQMAAS